MEHNTERWIGSICGILIVVFSGIVMFLLLRSGHGILASLPGTVGGVGILLLVRYVGDIPFPWEPRRHLKGGGD